MLWYSIGVRYAAIVFLLLAWQGPTPQKAAPDAIKNDAKANQQATRQAIPVKQGAPNSNQGQRSKQENTGGEESIRIVSTPKILTESKKDGYDKALVVATCLLVLVGGFQIAFLWHTVNAARKNAEAALLNAKALINTERPWLVVTWGSSTPYYPGTFLFGCKNRGNTPAKVISMSATYLFIDKPENLPVPPDYSSAATMPDLPFKVGGDEFDIGNGINVWSIIKNSGKEDLVNTSREFLVYYGNVVYRDTFFPDSSPEGCHETRWCFVYHAAGDKKLTRSGPEAYNRYT